MPSYTYKEGSLNLPALYKVLQKKSLMLRSDCVNECCNLMERRSVRLTCMGGKAIISDCFNFASLHNWINNNFDLN